MKRIDASTRRAFSFARKSAAVKSLAAACFALLFLVFFSANGLDEKAIAQDSENFGVNFPDEEYPTEPTNSGQATQGGGAPPAQPPQGQPPQGQPPQGQPPAGQRDGGFNPGTSGANPNQSTNEAAPYRATAANAQNRTTNANQTTDSVGAQLSRYFQPTNVASDVKGSPLTLERTLYGVYAPAQRLERLIAYWDLAGKYAEFNLCATYQENVESCIGKLGQNIAADVAALALSTRNNAKARRERARLSFQQAQYDFDAAFSTPTGRSVALSTKRVGDRIAALYIPSAAPATVAYQTRYDAMAARRRMSNEATRMNDLLPLLYDAMQSRSAQATAEYRLLVNEFENPSSASALFGAVERHFDATRDTIIAAIRYNIAIAVYS